MRKLIILLLLPLQIQALELKGKATSIDGKTVLYTEIHSIVLNEQGLSQKIETNYYKPDGMLFAQMTSDFSKNPKVPDIKFTDKRFDKTEQLTFNAAEKSLLFKTDVGGKNPKLKELKFNQDMVAGQGFDNFIKINFDNLQKSPVDLKFGVLSEMDFFSFKAYKKKESKKNIEYFGIDLSGFFLRMFFHELILEYDVETKQILSYQGLSNIMTDEGKKQTVLISYEHAKKPVTK